MTENENEWDRRLTALFLAGLSLPDERVEALYERILADSDTDADTSVWQVFTTVMTGLADRWQPVRQWAISPSRYQYRPA